ncbi:tRNA (adenosine(37)-N6)-threonylcarbamoyltransferase complex ATPase subunit type 1 TsaE [Gellertiella hungarica]|uniref:tRNA threonylcarbamoyladenosine biosynthesis protein TsaE n=1 Tax=Gellertiella hungarica TaxID=1572859 RepID=A0A7W6J8P5_9HYPH|nr:tRNA (adenosine(37)-N6)-threonylcarbamoyltransferase complex ATPase subunit type 1 TsaE [Gellertiella hungarica]MBB4066881.1 hypothetical protein [Gellertiella hungarica]
MQVSLSLKDDAATIRLGGDLALALRRGDVLALSGDLGAGKSTLARALLRTLADDADLEVPSPTFTLVQSYDLRIPAAHFDFYRLADSSELDELGFDEAIRDGIAIIEWPERMPDAIPANRIEIRITHEGDGRRADISAEGEAGKRIERSLAIRGFLERAGFGSAPRRFLTGDASVRAYEYLPGEKGERLILMDWPKPPEGPPVFEGKPYAKVAHIAQDAWPFIAIAQGLAERGFAVPEVLCADCEQGFLLLDDLGTDGVLDAQGQPIEERYAASVSALAALHGRPFTAEIHVKRNDCGAHVHRVPVFDRVPMAMETRLLLDWYVPWKTGREASPAERQSYLDIWNGLIDRLVDSETNLLLRDFHSPNIIWRGERQGLDRIGILDFQDSMIGPTAYDVASILQDARVTIPPDMADRLLEVYLSARRSDPPFHEARFRQDLALMEAQRNCKLAGLWVRLWKRDGKPGYMKHMPRTLAYLSRALEHDALAPLRNWFAEAQIGPSES